MNPEKINETNSYEQLAGLANLYFEGVSGDFEVDLLPQTHTVKADPNVIPDLANRDPETGAFYED
jgi:hypothetical protein